MSCARFIPEFDNWHCAAYPEGIPDEIIFRAWDHREPTPGDHGLQFVPKAKGDKDAKDD
jgi:hypothetical protein